MISALQMKSQHRNAGTQSFNAARRTSAVFAKVPSIIWGGFYMLLIPLFAVFYTCLPGESFYHSTIRHEAMYKRDHEAFEHDVEAWANVVITPRLSAALEQVYGSKPAEIHYYAGYGPDDFWPELVAGVDFPDGTHKGLDFYLGGMDHYTITKDMAFDPPRFTTEYSEGFDLTAKCGDAAECEATPVERALKPDNYFIATRSINDRVLKLRQLAGGLNYGADLHTFGRMLYLSAVTLTTVGYGDIVPLTDTARIAVACEAIFGIVLVGLFLNALAYEHQARRSETGEDSALSTTPVTKNRIAKPRS
ncbi:MAG TPA: potassium channel family protein [Longimicrobium sp.]|nr:potassium channel family protein [Longimicrobium sp.]